MSFKRISVEADACKIAVPPKPRYWQRHGKRSNPYSASGLDKFESVYAELSAKREYVANKIGVPEAMVRFVSSEKGWIPVVMGTRDLGARKKNSGGAAAEVSILGPVEKNNGHKDGVLGRKDEGNNIHGESGSIPISVLDEKSHSLVIPSSRFLKNTAFWVLAVCAMWVKFIVSGASNLTELFRNPKISQEAIAEQGDCSRGSPRPPTHTVSAPTSPLRAQGGPSDFWATASPKAVKPKNIDSEPSPKAVNPQNIDPEHKHHHQSKAKKYGRAVSMDNRPTRPERSENFYRPANMAYGANVGATVMIIALSCFVFYGRLCAIFFVCAGLYLFTMFREALTGNNGCRMLDLQSSGYTTKLIVDSWSESMINRHLLSAN